MSRFFEHELQKVTRLNNKKVNLELTNKSLNKEDFINIEGDIKDNLSLLAFIKLYGMSFFSSYFFDLDFEKEELLTNEKKFIYNLIDFLLNPYFQWEDKEGFLDILAEKRNNGYFRVNPKKLIV